MKHFLVFGVFASLAVRSLALPQGSSSSSDPDSSPTPTSFSSSSSEPDSSSTPTSFSSSSADPDSSPTPTSFSSSSSDPDSSPTPTSFSSSSSDPDSSPTPTSFSSSSADPDSASTTPAPKDIGSSTPSPAPIPTTSSVPTKAILGIVSAIHLVESSASASSTSASSAAAASSVASVAASVLGGVAASAASAASQVPCPTGAWCASCWTNQGRCNGNGIILSKSPQTIDIGNANIDDLMKSVYSNCYPSDSDSNVGTCNSATADTTANNGITSQITIGTTQAGYEFELDKMTPLIDALRFAIKADGSNSTSCAFSGGRAFAELGPQCFTSTTISQSYTVTLPKSIPGGGDSVITVTFSLETTGSHNACNNLLVAGGVIAGLLNPELTAGLIVGSFACQAITS